MKKTVTGCPKSDQLLIRLAKVVQRKDSILRYCQVSFEVSEEVYGQLGFRNSKNRDATYSMLYKYHGHGRVRGYI